MPEFLDKITESIDKSLRAVTSQAREVVETTKLKLGNCWGQLGLGDTEGRLTPTKAPGLPKVKAIAAGWRHSLAITESGEVYAWGRNDQGHLGLGDRQNRLTPAKVAVFR